MSTSDAGTTDAVARVSALTLVDALDLDTYHLWHVTRGDLLEQLG